MGLLAGVHMVCVSYFNRLYLGREEGSLKTNTHYTYCYAEVYLENICVGDRLACNTVQKSLQPLLAQESQGMRLIDHSSSAILAREIYLVDTIAHSIFI